MEVTTVEQLSVFISWAGEVSKDVAVTLRKHFHMMNQRVEFFMSEHDLGGGVRWGQELAKRLEQTNFGVICVTREALASQWVVFEAGALTKLATGRVCGLLLGDIKTSDVAGPLDQFQHLSFTRDNVLKLMEDINGELAKPLGSAVLNETFKLHWPEIQEDYKRALARPSVDPQPVHRTAIDMLEELVARARSAPQQNVGDASPEPASRSLGARPVTYDTLAWYTLAKFPGKEISERIQTILLRDLDRNKYPKIEDIDNAVNRAWLAVERYAQENPSVFGFGTDYITKSLGFVDAAFRSRHGFAKSTRDAFDKYASLVVGGSNTMP